MKRNEGGDGPALRRPIRPFFAKKGGRDMPEFQALVRRYQKRRRDAVMDSVAAGLSYADNVAVDLGLLEDTGLIDALTAAAAFALIAVTEQMQVILGKKTGRAGLSDAVRRMLKTGAAMGVGALAALAGGPVAAVPAAAGIRALLQHYQSGALLGLRVQERTRRMEALLQAREKRRAAPGQPRLAPGVEYLADTPEKQEEEACWN